MGVPVQFVRSGAEDGFLEDVGAGFGVVEVRFEEGVRVVQFLAVSACAEGPFLELDLV